MTLTDLLSNSTTLQFVAGLNVIRKAAETSIKYESKGERPNLMEMAIDTTHLSKHLEGFYSHAKIQNLHANLRDSIQRLKRYTERKKYVTEPVIEEMLKFISETSSRATKEEVVAWFNEHTAFATLAAQVKEYRYLSSSVCSLQMQIDGEKRIAQCTDPYLKITMQRHFSRHNQPYVSDAKKVLKDNRATLEALSYKMIATLVELDNVYNVG